MIDLKERYGEEIGAWLESKFNAFENTEEYDYMDNYRVYEIGNDEELKAYKNAEAEGCCGSHERIYMHWPSERKFMLGFNYGH